MTKFIAGLLAGMLIIIGYQSFVSSVTEKPAEQDTVKVQLHDQVVEVPKDTVKCDTLKHDTVK